MTRCVVFWGVICSTCCAEDPSPQMIRSWVAQLDSDKYVVREKATQQLIKAGPKAFDAVSKALRHPSPEVAWRTVEVLTQLAKSNEKEWLERVEKTLVAAGKSADHLRPKPAVVQPEYYDRRIFVF